ncbi:MAG: hypothetical protein JWM15_3226 [Cryptosporangiaceae bacterium]|jgi:hypothetical protein|nr:hypothetical protein [Cryptosporangiaceae bacterium]
MEERAHLGGDAEHGSGDDADDGVDQTSDDGKTHENTSLSEKGSRCVSGIPVQREQSLSLIQLISSTWYRRRCSPAPAAGL